MGVFAGQAIPAGTRIWQYDESMFIFDRAKLARLSPKQIHRVLHGGYLHRPSDRLLWYTDGMEYMNHAGSTAANVGLREWPPLHEDHTVALRDIRPGEELLEDYGFWSDAGLHPSHWLYPFYLQHCPQHFAFLSSLTRMPAAA
jgi:hypothetical protein